jgi:putative acetyltransferase
MQIFPYQNSDAKAVAVVFKSAVLEIGATAYQPEQIAVWSSYADNLENWQQKLSQGLTLVALDRGKIVAFGQLECPEHIAMLYVAPTHARRGYGTAIYQQLESQAVKQGSRRLSVEASRLAKHFFQKMGFVTVAVEWVERQGVPFERFRMEKVIGKLESASLPIRAES